MQTSFIAPFSFALYGMMDYCPFLLVQIHAVHLELIPLRIVLSFVSNVANKLMHARILGSQKLNRSDQSIYKKVMLSQG